MKKRKVDYRHYTCFAITLGFVACSVFCFRFAFGRLLESLRDVGLSLAFYFCKVFGINWQFPVSVTTSTKMPFVLPFNLPPTWSEFQVAWARYWQQFVLVENLSEYWQIFVNVLAKGSRWLLVLAPVVVVFLMLFRRLLSKKNNDYDKDSKTLVFYKKICKKVYAPVKAWVLDYVGFCKEHGAYWKLWLLIWAFSFNFLSIVFEAFAYYFYFVMSLDVVGLYQQVLKLFTDLGSVINFVPSFGWFCIAVAVVFVVRRSIGFARLQHYEMQNRGFINERPIVFMTVGTMGKKKTTMITDMALSMEVMFRDKAFEKILENDLKFPFFPWINLENSLRSAMERHSVYSLATCRRWVKRREALFTNQLYVGSYSFLLKICFGYDFNRYGFTYDNNLSSVDVWQVIETYAQLYYIYILQCSFLISNYSIRSDNLVSDVGNFPVWNSDFFRRDSRLLDSFSRHSHIVDFDALRLGQRVLKDNPRSDSFEFGVINLTEIGKERGNALELQDVKRNSKETNQKNDLFNSWLKMVRHSATVDNYPFVKVITDEQRPESWGADARDLCEIVHIDDCTDMQLAMPFFALEELLYTLVFRKFTSMYYEYRFSRGDNTLPMYLLKGFASKINHFYTRTYNQFGFMQLKCLVESGTQDQPSKSKQYFLVAKKIYSRRFSTDCYSDYFSSKSLRSVVGLEDLPEFKTEKASFEEMLSENSYFFNDLARIKGDKRQ